MLLPTQRDMPLNCCVSVFVMARAGVREAAELKSRFQGLNEREAYGVRGTAAGSA